MTKSEKIAKHILLSLDTKGINRQFLSDKQLLQDFVETLHYLQIDRPPTGVGRSEDVHRVNNWYHYSKKKTGK